MDLDSARAFLLEHARHPRNSVATLPDEGIWGEFRNPLCGDHVKLALRLKNGKIENVALAVQGCTICTASASVISENLKSLNPDEAMDLKDLFITTLKAPATSAWPANLENFTAFSHLRVNPSRMPCALVGWLALEKALRRPSPVKNGAG